MFGTLNALLTNGFAVLESSTEFRRMTEMDNKPTFRDSQQAFEQAIAEGILSTDPKQPNYAGNYMYMCTWDGVDEFKNIITRKYLGRE